MPGGDCGAPLCPMGLPVGWDGVPPSPEGGQSSGTATLWAWGGSGTLGCSMAPWQGGGLGAHQRLIWGRFWVFGGFEGKCEVNEMRQGEVGRGERLI